MFITIGDAQIYAASFGSKSSPTIVGIGGWIGSWELWAEPFSILSQNWHTLAYDHRGAGATLAPIESITFDRLVDDVFAVLDAYAIEHCILAAESAGALTAFGAALKNPDRITGLVIVDGLIHRQTPPEKDPFLLGLQTAYSATLDRFVDACLPEPADGCIKQWGRKIINRASQDAAVALHLMASSVDLRADLPRLAQPTLIIHGEADLLVPISEAHWLAKTLPQAKLVVLKDAGHIPTMTHPVEIAQKITAFFRPEI